MARIAIPTRDQAPPSTHSTLDAIGSQAGYIPNMFRMLASSPDTFAGVISFQGAMSRALNVKTRDAIALAVTQVNDCHYCRNAHTYIGKSSVKSSSEEITLNRQGSSRDPKRAAAVMFAKTLVERRGKVTDQELAAVRAAGYSDPEIIDITALAVQFVLTNFINNMANTDTDFPSVSQSDSR
ncbi:carboxymuconolactone decarboxylase family protein [Pseudomonas sp. URMO17WK12:I12]|uniref:carboxymuconolactone decarboxylase family protein n=1 Tax=Pseudomonas sp. URMO17WK12:I12 TaxID=1259797 RepID=UPI0005180E02|nr:carboxymuconolactone decarboxylase family protein [Pseudomonas sp. URMO17WK12:I12]